MTVTLKTDPASRPERIRSVCPHDCPSTCALDIERLNNRTIGKVYGASDHSYTAGVICSKVSRYAERYHHPDRLGKPLRRKPGSTRGPGAEFDTISWDDALDCVAENFQSVIGQHGAESIWPYLYAGTMGLIQRDGVDRLARALGTSLLHTTFCTTLADAGWNAGTGAKRGSNAQDIANSELLVVWGGNPVNTQVNIMHYLAKARRNNNAKFVVVDPYRTRTAEKADLHLMLKPGTDGALACAVMHVLLRDDYADRDFLADHTDFTAAFENHLSERTPSWAAKITGLPIEQIEMFAKMYGSARRAYIRAGYGFSRSRNGAVNMHAVTCLPSITGAWQHPGGGALYGNRDIYRIDKTLIMGLDVKSDHLRVLDQSRIGAILCGDEADLQGGAGIHALFVQNTNPALVAPDSQRVREGLMRTDLFTCVHEQFLTETAQFADIVLPATMFLEHHDIYQASGHTWFQTTVPVVDAYDECRSNHWVVCELAKRLGVSHPGFEMTEHELADQTLQASGMPDLETIYRQGGHDCSLGDEAASFGEGFATPDGRFHFQPDWSRVGPRSDGMPRWPDHWAVIDEPTEQYPYRLITAPARQFLNTSFTECPTSRKMERSPTLRIHPEDCRAIGLSDGCIALVSSRQGEILVETQVFEGVQRGTVVIESIWPSADFPGKVGVNTLVSADSPQPNGGAVFHDTAVRIEAVA